MSRRKSEEGGGRKTWEIGAAGREKAYKHLNRHEIGMNVCVCVDSSARGDQNGMIGMIELQLSRPISMVVQVPDLPS